MAKSKEEQSAAGAENLDSGIIKMYFFLNVDLN